MVNIEVKENLWNRTEGLCGVLDGDPINDIMTQNGQIPQSIVTAAASWKVDDLGGMIIYLKYTSFNNFHIFQHPVTKCHPTNMFVSILGLKIHSRIRRQNSVKVYWPIRDLLYAET